MTAALTTIPPPQPNTRPTQGFNKWIDRELEQSPQCGLIVYPEGHRNTLPGALPLKRGMLYYAHSRGLPVQVCRRRRSCSAAWVGAGAVCVCGGWV